MGGFGLIDPGCKSYPCLSRYERFFGRFAVKGRIYAKQLGQIVGNIFNNGFHGVAAKTSLFTLTQGFTGREYLAVAGFLACFGIKDSKGQRYIPEPWAKSMIMNAVFPKEWKRRGAGNPNGNLWGQ